MSKKMRLILGSGLLALLILAGVAAGLYLSWAKPYKIPAVDKKLTIHDFYLDFKEEQHTHPVSADITEAELLKQIRLHPDNLVYSTELRLRMNRESRTEEYISTLNRMEPTTAIKLQMALAYVDLLQDPDLGTAVLGQKSVQSIAMLDDILADNPYNLPAHYARGLNNLYWPQGLRRADKAIQDFAYCVAVEQMKVSPDFPFWPSIYAALGDALVKKGDVSAGIEAWQQGHRKFPGDPALSKRAEADKETAVQIVRDERGIDGFTRPDPAISDISILWTR